MVAKWLSLTPNPSKVPIFLHTNQDSQTDSCRNSESKELCYNRQEEEDEELNESDYKYDGDGIDVEEIQAGF